jgi:hypothetical protein
MEKRKTHRVVFERGFSANMIGDRRYVAASVVGGSIEGLPLKEFFLVLSTVGKAYGRCQLAWVNGDQVGVSFIKAVGVKKKSQQPVP